MEGGGAARFMSSCRDEGSPEKSACAFGQYPSKHPVFYIHRTTTSRLKPRTGLSAAQQAVRTLKLREAGQ
jgi:hypothetical protein